MHKMRTRRYKGKGGYTTKNITGNSNSKGLGVKTYRFHTKYNKKRWTRKN